jgi:23S rRNA (cytidine1920-2'-O)/16S rRNA (cytidine1409-2'-O)-methyltransferase
MATRRRLDVELTRRGLAETREQARAAIAEGRVLVDGAPADKPARQVAAQQALVVTDAGEGWVSRGAHKLLAALDAFAIDPSGRRCLDAGASTGGFTHVLLERGATSVIAVDVGYGQLADRVRNDPRVTVLERTNVRHLELADLPDGPVDMVVADLAFIGLATVLPALTGLATDEAEAVLLVKPQFEVGRDAVGKGGVVRDPDLWTSAIGSVARVAAELGWRVRGVIASPVRGPAGNVEFLVWLDRSPQPGARDGALDHRIEEAVLEGAEVRDA